MKEVSAENEVIYKWIQVAKEKVELHPIDKESPVPRSFIIKDFAIYFICYLIPPLILVLNYFADYPMKFYTHPFLKYVYNKIKHKLKRGETKEEDLNILNYYCQLIWIVINSFLLFILIFVVVATNTYHFRKFILVERFGTFGIYLLRCFANSYISAQSEIINDDKFLRHFPILLPEDMAQEEEENLKGSNQIFKPKHNAYDFYEYVNSLSKYKSEISWKGGLHLTILSTLIAFIPPLLILFLRERSDTLFEGFLVFANIVISFPISVVLLRGYMHSFSLYQSMKSTMGRLMKSTFTEKYSADSNNSGLVIKKHEKKVEAKGEEIEKTGDVKEGETPSYKKEVPDKVILNLTHPDNLRAYFHTHGTLIKRENSLESKLITLTVTVIAIICTLMVAVIFLNLYFEKHQNAKLYVENAEKSTGELTKRMLGTIIAMKNVDLLIMGYLVFVLVAAMIFTAFLGSSYNFSAKNAQAQYLYEVYLSATLELQCDGWNEKRMSKIRKEQLETVIKLVEAMSKHFENHVNDLGILGFSYSNLYWYVVAFFSANFYAIIKKQLNI